MSDFQYLKMKCLFDPCVKELAHSFTLYLFLNFFVGISLIYHAVIVSTGQWSLFVSYFRQNNHSLFSALVSAFAYLHYITCYSGLEFTFPDCIHLWGRNLILFIILSVTILALSSVQSLSCVRLFVTPWTAAHQASLSITDSQTLLKLMSIELVMPSNHLILCHLAHNMPSVNGWWGWFDARNAVFTCLVTPPSRDIEID